MRFPVLVAGGWFPDRPASSAGHGVGLRGAVAADPQAVPQLAQWDHATAAWAGGTLDAGGAGGAQRVDQPQHHRERGLRACSGEQLGGFFDGPRQLLLVGWFGDGSGDRRGDHVGAQPGVQRGDDLDQDPVWVALVVVGALRAPGPAVSVAEGDVPLLPASGARLGPREAG
jgi:hypothetical protein